MSGPFRSKHFAALLIALAVAMVPAIASGNSTPARSIPGSGGMVGPTRTAEVRIDKERLEFDFTSNVASPRVKASYDLVNVSGRDAALDLLFIAPAGSAPSIALNGSRLTVEEARNADLPKAWLAPKSGLDPLTGTDYEIPDSSTGGRPSSAWAFRVSLPAAGRGTMTAEYESLTGYDRARSDHIIRHLTYVLGPANNWAGFGGLEVAAVVPSRYILSSSPALQRSAESGGFTTYSATFDSIPAELMTISTVVAAQPLSQWVGTIGFALPFIPALILGIVSGMAASKLRRWFVAFLVGGAAAYFATMVLATALSMFVMGAEPLASASEDLSDIGNVTYGQIFSAVLLAPFAGSVIAALWAGIGSHRRTGRPSWAGQE